MDNKMEYYQLWITNLSTNDLNVERKNLEDLMNGNYGNINETVKNEVSTKLKILNEHEENRIY